MSFKVADVTLEFGNSIGGIDGNNSSLIVDEVADPNNFNTQLLSWERSNGHLIHVRKSDYVGGEGYGYLPIGEFSYRFRDGEGDVVYDKARCRAYGLAAESTVDEDKFVVHQGGTYLLRVKYTGNKDAHSRGLKTNIKEEWIWISDADAEGGYPIWFWDDMEIPSSLHKIGQEGRRFARLYYFGSDSGDIKYQGKTYYLQKGIYEYATNYKFRNDRNVILGVNVERVKMRRPVFLKGSFENTGTGDNLYPALTLRPAFNQEGRVRLSLGMFAPSLGDRGRQYYLEWKKSKSARKYVGQPGKKFLGLHYVGYAKVNLWKRLDEIAESTGALAPNPSADYPGKQFIDFRIMRKGRSKTVIAYYRATKSNWGTWVFRKM